MSLSILTSSEWGNIDASDFSDKLPPAPYVGSSSILNITELDWVGGSSRLGMGGDGIREPVHWRGNSSFPCQQTKLYLLPEPLLIPVMSANLPLRVPPSADRLCSRITSEAGFQPTHTLTSSLLFLSLHPHCIHPALHTLPFCFWQLLGWFCYHRRLVITSAPP